MAFLSEAIEIFRTHDHKVGVVECLERMGEVHKWECRYEEALSAFEKAVTIASRCGDKFGEARALMGLGSLEIYRNRLTEAVTIVLRASEIAKRIGWEQGIGMALIRLGTIRRLRDSGSEAEELLRESISVFRRCKFRRLDEAVTALEESCSLYLEISTVGDLEFPPAARVLAKLKGDLDAGLESLCWYDVAIAEYRKLQQKQELSACLAEKGDEAALHSEAAPVLDREPGNDQGVGWNRLQLRGTAKTVISWESRKFSKPRPARDQQTSPLLCNVNKLQRRIPHLATTGLKLEIRINGGGNG
ncbi:hypothetical protein M407DRAFT_28868 [Tulasnella calospora MUT 4182]|uniref:Uncharacterized protein n=1 Tax=Tulasnella calospora MUT 4182 TaxID=1051891 RepID=A0A0C3Q9X5_9AGAM|nr:hypothetical protein M407DRAFT_28868 [Tulasnella calospora MUT 4182]